MDQIELVQKAKRGDKAAFLALISPLEQKLFQTGLGIVGSQHDAQDAWQNTVLKAWSNIRQLHRPEYFRTWLTRILLNEAKAVLRQRKASPLPQEMLPELSAPAASVEDNLIVHSCLQRLPREQREAILLRYWLDLPLDEIASAMHVPLGTAKTRLYQGMRVLKEMIKEVESLEECRQA